MFRNNVEEGCFHKQDGCFKAEEVCAEATRIPWFADLVNFLAVGEYPADFTR